MEPLERVEIMLEAINAMKVKAYAELKDNNPKEYVKAMEALLLLECSLVFEAQQLVDSIKKVS